MKKNSHVNRYTLLLMLAGVGINIAGARLALYFRLPIFLDSIGTVLAAALGGYLPGICAGFFSNLINGISDPITLYYGIISVIMAAFAAFLSGRGVFRRWWRALLSVLVFAAVGGGLGSLLTWLLYGFNFGSGISAPFAEFMYTRFLLPKFYAQFSADLLIDLLDKLITVPAVFVVLKLLPDSFKGRFPLGRINSADGLAVQNTADVRFYRRLSLKTEVLLIIVVTAAVLGTLATTISAIIYNRTMIDRHMDTVESAAELMVKNLDADSVSLWLETGRETEDYLRTRRYLQTLRDTFVGIEYIYVYEIRPEGCRVVFDTDTSDVPGGRLGDMVDLDADFAPYMDSLLAGEEIEPVITNGQYGWLLTAYKPVRDASGVCVAYAAADVDMADVITERYVFIIKMASLLFAASIIIVLLTVWFSERRIVGPINAMTEATEEFAYDSEEERLQNVENIKNLPIHTGDELENLHQALTRTVQDTALYINNINRQSAYITTLQNNIIIAFAQMVESRDENTGEHVLHTARYVELICDELMREGLFSDTLTAEYRANLIRSAPLHDIGKIKISDALLNKPGRLTPEEFDEMKTHTTAGRDILAAATSGIEDDGYLTVARDLAAYHHERWDGRGYPEGLAGESIPLCARIMAVADVFDALISRRSYKEPYPFDEAVDIILDESGTHFDSRVVEAFLAARARVREAAGL